MQTNNIFVWEYLESLKEDGELDRILPILLRNRGWKIVRTPKGLKGQKQFGKDIIAYGKDEDNIEKAYYIEVKGNSDKDITENTILKTDGLFQSLTSAALVDFNDYGIPHLQNLPVKVIFVHNGIVHAKAENEYNGIIKLIFGKSDKQFERWGIEQLTDLFSKYLFSEYLLTDDKNLKLFKKTLALIDQPEYDLHDYKNLVDSILNEEHTEKSRALSKMFSTLNLVSLIIWHYAGETNNLLPAIDGVAYTVSKTWAWILKKNQVKKKPILKEYIKLLSLQRDLLKSYFDKTLPVARLQDGLFSESGGPFEEIGYPLRAMDYLCWLIYYFELELAGPGFDYTLEDAQVKGMQHHQKSILRVVIDHNIGTKTPLLDRHSRAFTLVALFFLRSKVLLTPELHWLRNFLVDTYNRIENLSTFRGRLPEFTDNMTALLQSVGAGERSGDYNDKSSMLLLILTDLLVVLEDEDSYNTMKKNLTGRVDLQTAYPDWQKPNDVEVGLFEGNISDLTAVDSGVILPESIEDYKQQLSIKPYHPIPYKTDAVGFKFLRTLSYIYFHNDIPPDEWRQFITNSPIVG